MARAPGVGGRGRVAAKRALHERAPCPRCIVGPDRGVDGLSTAALWLAAEVEEGLRGQTDSRQEPEFVVREVDDPTLTAAAMEFDGRRLQRGAGCGDAIGPLGEESGEMERPGAERGGCIWAVDDEERTVGSQCRQLSRLPVCELGETCAPRGRSGATVGTLEEESDGGLGHGCEQVHELIEPLRRFVALEPVRSCEEGGRAVGTVPVPEMVGAGLLLI